MSLISIIGYTILLVVVYILYQTVFKMYYVYFYYKRQGVPTAGFPLPLIGTMHKMIKHFKYHEFMRSPTLETIYEVF